MVDGENEQFARQYFVSFLAGLSMGYPKITRQEAYDISVEALRASGFSRESDFEIASRVALAKIFNKHVEADLGLDIKLPEDAGFYRRADAARKKDSDKKHSL